MSRNHKPVAIAIGAALAGGLTLAGSAFAMQPLASGYMVATPVAEGSCGAAMTASDGARGDKTAKAEGKCGEGKCGMDAMDADKDGRVSRAEFTAMHAGGDARFAMHDADKDGFISAGEMQGHMEGKCGEGKCGEGKCGADMKAGAGKGGGDAAMQPAADAKAAMEGKCGEGKCGSN